jgi:long-chain acyl-CoA synthetase
MTEPQTLAQYWLDNVKRWPGSDQIAARQKDLGIWQSYSWTQEYEHVRDFSLGLVELGLQQGERVALLGDNDLEYLWGILAVLAAGGVVVGIFTDVTPKEVQYVVSHSDATFVLAGDQEQCDKLLAIQQTSPLVRKVIYWDERGMWGYDGPWLMDFKAVQALGRAVHERDPARFEALIAQGQPGDVAMFCYTSGTTGLPKGAMISHANFIYVAEAFDAIERVRASDNYMSFIPMAWIGGAALDLAPHCISGVTLNFAEGPDTVQQNIREIAPDAILYNSRLWENLVSSIQVRMSDASWINRLLYKAFQPVGYRMADYQLRRQQAPLHWRLLHSLGHVAFYRPVLSQYGLQRARTAYTAGAALSPDVVRFFLALGLPLRQIYGSTEVTGGAIAHRPGDIKFESIGVPLPDARMMISPEGEILLTSPGLFVGYHKDLQATEAALYRDEENVAWFRTGDAGLIDDDGHLIYLDRVKDMIELASGERYSPQYIEGRLKFSPYVSHCMTVGDQTLGYVTALLTIDYDSVGRWAEKRGLAFTTYTDLAQKPEVYALVRDAVERVNATLPPAARVRKFVLLHKEFDADEGEMTRTRKLRRGFLAQRYADIVQALYDGRQAVQVTAQVEYQDGRVGKIDTTLRVEAL